MCRSYPGGDHYNTYMPTQRQEGVLLTRVISLVYGPKLPDESHGRNCPDGDHRYSPIHALSGQECQEHFAIADLLFFLPGPSNHQLFLLAFSAFFE